jgi:hypothetical protein
MSWMLQDQRTLQVLGAVQAGAQEKVTFQQGPAVLEDLQNLMGGEAFIHQFSSLVCKGLTIFCQGFLALFILIR